MIYLCLVLLGLCFGSFVNALVWRLQNQSKAKSLKLKAKDLSVLHGRSMCTHCHHMLAWHDLLPVISWLSLGGKCRYCLKPISWQYPLVEIATAMTFVVSYIYFPYSLLTTHGLVLFIFWLVFLVGFMALFVYDLKWMLLPNKIVYPLTALAVSQVVVHAILVQDFSVISRAVFGLMTVGGLFYVLYQVSSGKWIGGGDVKLGFVLGLLAGGFIEGLLVIFIASLIGTVISVPLLRSGKTGLKKRIPFGPLLITALLIVYLFGASIIHWYTNKIVVV